MRTSLRISATILLTAAIARSQTPPADAPTLPTSEPVSPSSPLKKPGTTESLPLVPGGGKVVPPSAPFVPAAPGSQTKNPSDASTYPARYRNLLGQAMSSFHTRDFKGAMAALAKADEILPPTPWSLNIRGAIQIEQRQWEEGARDCMEALRIDPGFFPAKFNLCEIPFYQGRYAEARAMWERLSLQQPKDELLMYRIFLTYLLEGDVINTEAWLKKMPFPSETPAYQYAHAAYHLYSERLARQNKDSERAAKEAEKSAEWIKSAEFIWAEQKRANFVDVLMQLGWVKREELATQ
jgi:hypothetical protein